MKPVGVIGASGGVGRAAVRRLRAAGVAPLRLGGRRVVDLRCPESLAAFCAGCRLVVNCAGPAHEPLDAAALGAWAAGADVVETGGDDAVHERLARRDPAGRTAVVSAGMMPGLSGLLPRCLAAGFDRPVRMTGYAGGVGRLTPAAAADYVAGGSGEALAGWRHRRRVSRVLVPLRDVELPPFPGRVSAHPFLSTELERTARALGLEEASWFNVLDGAHLPAALARSAAAEELVLASELDLFGRVPYQLMVLEMEDDAGAGRILLLRAGDGIELTGAVTALAALAILDGEVPPGVHYAAEALPPAAWWERLRRLPEVQVLQVAEGLATEAALEEGVL